MTHNEIHHSSVIQTAVIPFNLWHIVGIIQLSANIIQANVLNMQEGNVLFNDALNTFYLRLYSVGHMVNDHSDSERENPLPLRGLRFTINSKGSFICTIPQPG